MKKILRRITDFFGFTTKKTKDYSTNSDELEENTEEVLVDNEVIIESKVIDQDDFQPPMPEVKLGLSEMGLVVLITNHKDYDDMPETFYAIRHSGVPDVVNLASSLNVVSIEYPTLKRSTMYSNFNKVSNTSKTYEKGNYQVIECQKAVV